MALLDVKNLTVDFNTDQGLVHAVRDISFTVGESEAVGIVGESGSGKSVTMYSVMGLLASNGEIKEGSVVFDGKEITEKSYPNHKAYEDQMSRIRGNEMAMIFQDPMTFLNPVVKIGKQITEVIKNHNKVNDREAKDRAVTLMGQVGIPSPGERFNQYPHEFSGGMRQRIIIAMALANSPKLIIADEPTTALDVTIQAQVLELIKDMKEQLNSSVIMITHDLGVVASVCDRIIIMYGGKIVEEGDTREIFYEPKHPYTMGLLRCVHNPEKKEKLTPIPGSPPDLLKPPAGCPFVDRCSEAMRICKTQMPHVARYSQTHTCSCWLEEVRKRKGENHG
ncbi:MAG: ABC transporter ATP-binding protein [Hungatella sp.]|nr:ABC transporter ATP-binding protein [Hungatella sp.]